MPLGSDLNFGLRISAQDDTQSALRSAASGLAAFARTAIKPIEIPLQIARSSLGLFRDIDLGLRPLISGIDSFITRGSGLDAIQKSFVGLARLLPFCPCSGGAT